MSNFHGLYIFTEETLLIKIGTTCFNTLFSMRNKFFLASIMKCSYSGGKKVIECRFSILWISEAFLLQEVIVMFEKVKICR